MEEALNLWANMYNKADKERFNLLLENAMLKQELEKLKEKIDGRIIEPN